jgi:O-antigen ligase
MLVSDERHPLVGVTAATVTTAAFGKIFLPFYLIGSTAIFAAASLIGAALIAIGWRPISDMASKITDALLLLGALYAYVVLNFLFLSRPAVPLTYLFGILIFHALFLIFGFAAARALNVVLTMLMGAAAIYLAVIIRYTIQFGDLEQNGYLHDIFGVGKPALFVTFHQNIGLILGLAALAAIGLASNRIKKALVCVALPLVLLFIFYISARGALVAVVCGLISWIGADLWVRSKKLALVSVIAVTIALTSASIVFYRYALHDTNVDAVAPDAISRTIREIQDPRPGFRTQIWARAWHRISSEPEMLPFGRGIGMFPVNEGVGAPDWLLHMTEGSKHYIHNVHLEMLYETGITGLLLFSILTAFPLIAALRRWQFFSSAEKSVVSIYVFNLVSADLSGNFALSYMDQFFFALTVGIIALERAGGVGIPNRFRPIGESVHDMPLKL